MQDTKQHPFLNHAGSVFITCLLFHILFSLPLTPNKATTCKYQMLMNAMPYDLSGGLHFECRAIRKISFDRIVFLLWQHTL